MMIHVVLTFAGLVCFAVIGFKKDGYWAALESCVGYRKDKSSLYFLFVFSCFIPQFDIVS